MKNWIKDNPFIDIAIVTVVVVLSLFGGCQVTVPSLTEPTQRVTRTQLEIELQTLLDTAEMRFKQIDRQESFRRELLNHALLISQSGTINLYGLIPLALSVLGAGAVADNVRKRKVIRNNLTEYVKTVKENPGPAGDSA
ncbi:hypothetical protein ES705_36003 [subsurface metagenome]